ncbi:hypothetical protein [Phenylobacterium sp. J367]|uniref:hypothetical protein n=1 Tax=Phenylobacterium sp. J367 TaxID=2898435 RepID=UPI0021518D16|nr:hypothetical protein [Phenylobacterium sp. J367]MCR5877073.1 hypothetical protein [Phenylobacterium sp. J367]
MNLMERYLAAVGRDLPEAQRADIVAELRDELLSKVEEREAELRRPLERRELEALLIDYGHPLVVAGRYRKIQHLVGPEVFPFWWAGLRAALVIGAGVYFVLALIRFLVRDDLSGLIAGAIPDLWEGFLIIFAIATLIAVAVEHSGGMGRFARWRPSELPPVKARPRSRFDTVVEVGLGVVFILWWVGAIRFRDFAPGELQMTLGMAATWDAWRMPVLAYLLFELGANLLALLRPAWVRANAALRLVRNAAGAGLLYGIAQTGPWIVFSDPTQHSVTEATLNRGFGIGLAAASVVMALMAAHSAWRLVRALSRPDGAGTPAAA